MPFSVRLDPKMVSKLAKIAMATNRPVSDVVREAVAQYIVNQTSGEDVVAPYERMKHLIGCVSLGSRRSGESTGDAFFRLLQEQRRARRAR